MTGVHVQTSGRRELRAGCSSEKIPHPGSGLGESQATGGAEGGRVIPAPPLTSYSLSIRHCAPARAGVAPLVPTICCFFRHTVWRQVLEKSGPDSCCAVRATSHQLWAEELPRSLVNCPEASGFSAQSVQRAPVRRNQHGQEQGVGTLRSVQLWRVWRTGRVWGRVWEGEGGL